MLVQNYGWDAAFIVLIIAGVSGSLLFLAAWPAKANAYEIEPKTSAAVAWSDEN